MGILMLAIVGGVLGWAVSLLIPLDKQGVLVNVVAGMLGALLGGWLLRPLFGMSSGSPGLLESTIGALVLLVVVHLVRRGMRTDHHGD